MRIAFDHQAFCLQVTGGISRYFCRLADELFLAKQTVGVFAPVHRNSYLGAVAAQSVHGYHINNYPPKTASLMVRMNSYITKPLIRAWRPSLVHETFYSTQRSAPKGCPTIITVFDMIDELIVAQSKESKSISKSSAKYIAAHGADHIISISEHTRQDLIRLFNIPAQKVSVVHLGCERFLSTELQTSIADQVPIAKKTKPYFLYVGQRGGYKNFEGFVTAFSTSTQLKNDFDIIAAGGGPFSLVEQNLFARLGLQPAHVQQCSVDDAQLGLLYARAVALVYPSCYEGFGLPPIEAMSYDCPVASSNTSSMPEIIGDAAMYFDPTSPDEILSALNTIAYDEKCRQSLILKGRERVKRYSWKKCADKTLNIYRSLIATA